MIIQCLCVKNFHSKMFYKTIFSFRWHITEILFAKFCYFVVIRLHNKQQNLSNANRMFQRISLNPIKELFVYWINTRTLLYASYGQNSNINNSENKFGGISEYHLFIMNNSTSYYPLLKTVSLQFESLISIRKIFVTRISVQYNSSRFLLII